MKTKFITAPENAIYLSEFMCELPKGLLNKNNTGAGATSIALEDNHNTIIAVPNKKLILNKCKQYPNNRCNYIVLGVYDVITDNQILNYINSNTVKKIMVTYDSLERLSKLVSITEYRIVVDEMHRLIKDYAYRNSAILSLLNTVKNHDYVSYITATPIKNKYLPPKLKDLDITEVVWPKTVPVKPIRIKTNKPWNAVCNIIKQYQKNGFIEINNHRSYEAMFFINSVVNIKNIIDSCDLSQNDVKIVCADNKRNRTTLEDLEINEPLDENKMFTFITSSSFEGCDFNSDSAITYIVTNYQVKHTLCDIDTDMTQIIGRNRSITNPFKNIFYHIYNNNTSSQTNEEFNSYLLEVKTKSENLISGFTKLNKVERNAFATTLKYDNEDVMVYYDKNTDSLLFDEYKYLYTQFEFEQITNTYKNGSAIREAYLNAGFDVTEASSFELYANKIISKKVLREKFYDVCIEYIELRSSYSLNINRINEIESKFPLIKESYNTIGHKRLKALGYNQTKIKQEIISCDPSVKTAVYYNLCKHICINCRYTNVELKEIIATVYKKLAINKTAKATDIKKYFDIKECKVNGNRGFEIIKKI